MIDFIKNIVSNIPHKLVIVVATILLSITVGYISFTPTTTAQANHKCCLCEVTCPPKVIECAIENCTCQSREDTKKTKKWITDEFIRHRKWLIMVFWESHILPAMMLMTEQISTLAIYQTLIIGSFFDAKHQLETQRLLQSMQADAHKSYQPSEGMCQFGTSTRSLAAADGNTDFTQIALSARSVQRRLLSGDTIGVGSKRDDLRSRLQNLKNKYCNKQDFGGQFNEFCLNNDKRRINNDINITQMLGYRNTLKIDFSKEEVTPDEEDIFALSANLYGHELAPRIAEQKMANKDGSIVDGGAFAYLKLRARATKRSVAQAAFAAQAAMKAQGEKEVLVYMKAILEEMGIGEEEIKVLLAEERPSYYAQMEILTKKLYQSPDFYADLYDKPANVDRKRVAMQAISLMQKRDMYRSQLRKEAIMAVWLETRLREMESLVVNETNPFKQGTECIKIEGMWENCGN